TYTRHLGFELADRAAVDAKAAELRAAGHEVAGPEYINPVVGYILMVRDPDGRVVEFSTEQDCSPANWDPEAR
ncbi:MAG: hypothetical protein KC466_12820, partial [Myxococcales bacterium]|nr:hypothetical protein [Myxococcales bacterium]